MYSMGKVPKSVKFAKKYDNYSIRQTLKKGVEITAKGQPHIIQRIDQVYVDKGGYEVIGIAKPVMPNANKKVD